MAKCKGCGAPIVWVKSLSGRMIPCDAQFHYFTENPKGSTKIVTPNGEVLSADLTEDAAASDGIGYISHFSTCPRADSFRRRAG